MYFLVLVGLRNWFQRGTFYKKFAWSWSCINQKNQKYGIALWGTNTVPDHETVNWDLTLVIAHSLCNVVSDWTMQHDLYRKYQSYKTVNSSWRLPLNVTTIKSQNILEATSHSKETVFWLLIYHQLQSAKGINLVPCSWQNHIKL